MNDETRPIVAGRANEAAVGAPDSIAWKIHREIVLLAGWGRAILLQLAHPLVAQGVADHSGFATESGGHVRRLSRTLHAMLDLTFGQPHDAARAAERINRIHDRVHGALAGRTGAFAAGTGYSAHDPALLAWVHATLLDSFLVTYELFVAPLSAGEGDRYCAESSRVEPLLGVPEGRLPRSHVELTRFIADKLAGQEICVGDTARALSRQVLYPPMRSPLWPLVGLARLPTVGLLPPAIRQAYGLSWSPRRERALRTLAAVSRGVLPALPSLIRHWPASRTAARAAR